MGHIRRAKEEDRRQVRQLISALEGAEIDEDKFSAVYDANILNPSISYFVYEENHAILGFISLHVQRLLHHTGSIGEIQEFIVEESARGTGIGSLLFKMAEEESRLTGCVQMEVCCNQKRLASHEFYESRGMTNNHYKFCLRLDKTISP